MRMPPLRWPARCSVIVFALGVSLFAQADTLTKTLIASDIADHVSRIERGLDLMSELALSPSDTRKVAAEIRSGVFEDFKKPVVKMIDPVTVSVSFGNKSILISFKNLHLEELRVQGKAVNLKGSKTYANYRTEVSKILKLSSSKPGEVGGVIAAIVTDVGYRLTNSSLRDYGGSKARSAASEEKNLAAGIIGFYRAKHARCVRSQHDAEREISEFCSNEKFHPECLLAQQQADRNCEGQVDSYFVCKGPQIIAYGTWSMEKRGFLKQSKRPSADIARAALKACCEQDGCYKAVRHDLVDIMARAPASEEAKSADAPEDADATSTGDRAPASAPIEAKPIDDQSSLIPQAVERYTSLSSLKKQF